MDRTSVQQAALDLLGNRTLRKETPAWEALQRHYSSVIRFCTEQSDWSFARRLVTLEPQQNGTYALPVDCLRVRDVRMQDRRKLPCWELINREIVPLHGNCGKLTLLYTCDYTLTAAEELPDAAPTFCRFVITTLAARIAPAVIGEDALQLVPQLEQQAERYRLQAIQYDMQQSHSNDQSPLHNIFDMLRNR